MRLPSHIFRQPSGIYYYRFVIPRDLHQLFGLSELRRSLGTRDSSTAKQLAYHLGSMVMPIIDQARRTGQMPHPVEVPEEAEDDLPDITFRFVRSKGYARVGGENISLSNQERVILIAFFDQPEHELSKRQIQDASGSQAQNFKVYQALKRIPQVEAMVHYQQVEKLYRLDIPLADAGLDL